MARKMPPQKRGKSDSAKGTPPEFISAVQSRFGGFLNIDLAATEADRKAGRYISPEEDSLSMDWAALPELQRPQGLAWLNPPYDRIEPWAWKCAETMKDPRVKGRILFLVPASVGAKWFEESVWGKARCYFLRDRIQFMGEKWPYPKDNILAVYGEKPGVEFWKWGKR